MIDFGESVVKGMKMATQSGVTVTIKWCAYLSRNSFDGNLFAIEFFLSIFKMMHS